MIGMAALGIWMEIDGSGEGEFGAWYRRQHLPERLSVPGFLRGRRYATTGSGPRYFTLYEAETPEVFSSAPYLERLNAPTDWTRRALPLIHRMVRNAYGLVAASATDRVERDAATVRIAPHSGRGPYVRDWLAGEGVRVVTAGVGVAACGFFASNTAGTAVMTEERRLVGGEVTSAAPFLAWCELSDAAAEPDVREFWRGWATKMAADVEVDAYRLLYGLTWIP